MIAIKKNKLLILSLIDLLALPRLPGLAIPISLLPILVLVLIDKNKHRKTNLIAFFLLSLFVFLSVANGALQQSQGVMLDNLKRGLQLISMFGYYFYFKQRAIEPEKITLLLRAFFIWVFIFLIAFTFRPVNYEFIVGGFFRETEEFLSKNISNMRFPFIFSDPNSAGYLIAMCAAFYIKIERNVKWLALVSIIGFVSIYATQSRGAILGTFMILLAFCLDVIRMKRLGVAEGLTLVALLIFVSAIIWQEFGSTLIEVADNYSARMDSEDDFGGGRMDKYKYMFENLNFLPIGIGYEITMNGLLFRPHSDLIRWNFSYGLLSLPFLIILMLPRSGGILIFIVALIPFLVNSLIDDYRLFATYLILYPLAQSLNFKSAKSGKI